MFDRFYGYNPIFFSLNDKLSVVVDLLSIGFIDKVVCDFIGLRGYIVNNVKDASDSF